MLALLFTSPNEQEFNAVHKVIHSWRWTLQYHARSSPELFLTGLQRIDSFFSVGAESLVNMVRSPSLLRSSLTHVQWRRKKQLAIFSYGNTGGSRSHTPGHSAVVPIVPDVFPFFPLMDGEATGDNMQDFSSLLNLVEPPLFPVLSPSALPDGHSSPSQRVDDFFWQSSTGSSLGFPYDFWSQAAFDQPGDLQIGLLPDLSSNSL
jgi:hypothetical protein